MNSISPISLKATLEPITPIQPTPAKQDNSGLTRKEEKAFQDFEKMFVHMMLKEMRKTMNGSSMTEKSHATKMYEEMMDEAMAEQMTMSQQLGVAKDLATHLKADRIRQKLQSNETTMMMGALAKVKV